MTWEFGAGECPLPDAGEDAILLAHGEGGRLTRRLIQEELLPRLENPWLSDLGDAAALSQPSGPLALTTDSFVVSPLFFPGGDIGRLAVFGTVNDLVVAGAHPQFLTLALVIEEGLPLETLRRVLASVAEAAASTGVHVVAGDTKVVPRGAADKLFINTTGLGETLTPTWPGPRSIQPGDRLLVSGPMGRHGSAVLACREGLEFQTPLTSDCAPLMELALALREANVRVRALRDATRGGVAAVLHEWADRCGHTFMLDESSVPVDDSVRGLCEALGLDPLHVANEGTLVAAVPAEEGEAALDALRSVPLGRQAMIIGEVQSRRLAPVVVRRLLDVETPLDEPLGAPLPRIC